MSLAACIENNLERVDGALVFGKEILSYSKRELAALCIFHNDRYLAMIEEKHRQLRNIINLRKGG